MEPGIIAADSAQWAVKKLIEKGIAGDSLLHDTGLDPGWPWAEQAEISFDQYCILIRRAYELTNEPALALNLSREFSIAELGIMGYAIMSCSTLADAILNSARYWELAGQLLKIQVEIGDPFWSFSMFPANPSVKGQILVYAIEEVLTSNFVAKSFLVNQQVFPDRIEVTYPAPNYTKLYEERFQCAVQFESTRNCYLMSSELARLPIVTSQPEISDYCQRQCDQILSQMTGTDGLVDKIRRLIFNSTRSIPRIEQVASELKVSPRTLHRKLKQRSTTYQEILDEVREEIAKRYLTGTCLTIDQISDLMGFAETTSFRRSFKRWTGMNAARYRTEHQN
jgi:AraC-like DNA-binding protein